MQWRWEGGLRGWCAVLWGRRRARHTLLQPKREGAYAAPFSTREEASRYAMPRAKGGAARGNTAGYAKISFSPAEVAAARKMPFCRGVAAPSRCRGLLLCLTAKRAAVERCRANIQPTCARTCFVIRRLILFMSLLHYQRTTTVIPLFFRMPLQVEGGDENVRHVTIIHHVNEPVRCRHRRAQFRSENAVSVVEVSARPKSMHTLHPAAVVRVLLLRAASRCGANAA